MRGWPQRDERSLKPRTGSGRSLVGLVILKKVSRWLGLGPAKVRPKYVLGVAVEAVDEILMPHIVVDVWMVVRGTDADAFELLDPNTDLREAEVVLELHVMVVAHEL